MAKDVFKTSQVTDLVGRLDINDENEMVVYVEQKDSEPLEVDILGLLEKNKGRQLSLKLTDEQVAF